MHYIFNCIFFQVKSCFLGTFPFLNSIPPAFWKYHFTQILCLKSTSGNPVQILRFNCLRHSFCWDPRCRRAAPGCRSRTTRLKVLVHQIFDKWCHQTSIKRIRRTFIARSKSKVIDDNFLLWIISWTQNIYKKKTYVVNSRYKLGSAEDWF